MHMTDCPSNNETPNGTSFWSYCLALVTTFAFADVLTGGSLHESIAPRTVEYVLAPILAIVTFGVSIKEGPPGLLMIRSCSFNKL